MSGKNIEDLYAVLFDTIDKLKSGAIDVAQARATSEISQVIVNAARVQVEYKRVSDQAEARFLGKPEEPLPNGIIGVRRHLLKGD